MQKLFSIISISLKMCYRATLTKEILLENKLFCQPLKSCYNKLLMVGNVTNFIMKSWWVCNPLPRYVIFMLSSLQNTNATHRAVFTLSLLAITLRIGTYMAGFCFLKIDGPYSSTSQFTFILWICFMPFLLFSSYSIISEMLCNMFGLLVTIKIVSVQYIFRRYYCYIKFILNIIILITLT